MNISQKFASLFSRSDHIGQMQIEDAIDAALTAPAGIRVVEDMPLIAKTEVGATISGLNGIEPGRDIWNGADPMAAFTGPANRGPSESASGDGADAMTRRYSALATQGMELTRQYSALGERLANIEKAVSAIVAFVAKSNGGSFPSDSSGANGGAEDHGTMSSKRNTAEQDNSDEDQDAAAVKAGNGQMPLMNVPGFMDALASRSRPGVSAPPSFVAKAGAAGDTLDDRLAVIQDNPEYDFSQTLAAADYVHALKARAGGVQVPTSHLAALRTRCGSAAMAILEG